MLYKAVDSGHFGRNVNLLWTVLNTFLTAYAVIGLTQTGHATVVAHKECLTRLAIVFGLSAFGHIALVDTLVVVRKDAGNVEAVGARHAILTVVAGHGGILHHDVGRIVEKLHFLVGKRL